MQYLYSLSDSLRTTSISSVLKNSNFTKATPTGFIKAPLENAGVCKDVVTTVNRQLDEHKEGRLFAVVHLCGKQFKVTAGDLIIVEGYWPPTIGDRIRLDKV